MGDFGNGSIDKTGGKAGQGHGSESENHDHEQRSDADHLGDNGQKPGILPAKLVSETSILQPKSQQNKQKDSTGNPKILDFVPLMLDGVMLQAKPPEKSYSMVVDLDAEIARKLANAPQPVKDFYKGTREGQMAHEPIGLARMEKLNPKEAADYRDKWAGMNGWLAFSENDKDCEEGRKITQEYLKHLLDRKRAVPNAAEKEKDNQQLAKIYSLMLNDHDYLHNEAELTRRNGMQHLSEVFTGVGINGEAKTFNLKALAETHMFALLQSSDQNPTYKSPLKPDERATLAFYTQMLRQVLPAELLDDAHKKERDVILKDYVNKYKLRDTDLAKAGKDAWRVGMNDAMKQYSEMAKIKSVFQLTDTESAESIYERVNLADIRQLVIEAHELRTLPKNFGKESELAYPDYARFYNPSDPSKVKIAMREYREGAVLEEKLFLDGVFGANGIKKYVHMAPFSKDDLRLKQWKASPNNWQTIYWNDDPNLLENRIQREIVLRFPRSLQCSLSNEGAGLVRIWMQSGFVPGNVSDRLAELGTSLRDATTKKSCVHDSEPRKKPSRNKGF